MLSYHQQRLLCLAEVRVTLQRRQNCTTGHYVMSAGCLLQFKLCIICKKKKNNSRCCARQYSGGKNVFGRLTHLWFTVLRRRFSRTTSPGNTSRRPTRIQFSCFVFFTRNNKIISICVPLMQLNLKILTVPENLFFDNSRVLWEFTSPLEERPQKKSEEQHS